jgi:hypothetical protein
MSNGQIFGRVSAASARSLGLITRARAHRLGATDAMLRSWAADLLIVPTSRHVFRVAAAPVGAEQRVLASCLAAGPDALASHRTAAALHRFDGVPKLDQVPIDVLLPRQARFRTTHFVVHRSANIAAIDRCYVGVIPATSPMRTIIDLGAVASPEQVEEALDGAERDGKVKRRALEHRVAELRAPGRTGIATIAAILDGRGAVPASVLERRFMRVLDRHGLPRPVPQHAVRRRDGRDAFLDFAYPEAALAIELQGNKDHATPAQRASDYERANQLPDWRFVSFTYEDVMRREHYVAEVVGTHLEATRMQTHAPRPTPRHAASSR